MTKRDIIVIGTSAGGLNALIQLIKDLPATLEASLLIVIHTRAKDPSLLKRILQNRTELTVLNPTNGQAIRPRHIYVAPPDYHMMVQDGRICLTRGPRVNHTRPAIDPLFHSAAVHYGPRVIGVILTGMLDDGTVGLEFIKTRGGLTIVQDPEEAEYPEMPRTALENARVDHCLRLSDIAPRIIKIVKVSVKTKAKSVPPLMQAESKLSAMSIISSEKLNHIGKISAFSCLECQGTLWEIDRDKVLRYRCRIGHAFGPQSLLAAHDESMENILWAAVRILEENAELSQHIATRAAGKNHGHTANHFRHKGKIAEQQAKKLKAILFTSKLTTAEKN